VSVSQGALHLSIDKIRPDSVWAGTCSYSAGMVSTYHRFSQRYGRFEARIKVDPYQGNGLHEAFWMWPDDRVPSASVWPEAGEIDVAEQYSGLPHSVIPYLHYGPNDNGGYLPGVNTSFGCAAERGVFNTFTLEWSVTKLTVLVNGKTCLVNTSGDSAFQKPYILALTQAIGDHLNGPDGQTPFPARMDVDYVRVWK
jgi:beta-glucanase (GH16 family)